MPDPVLVATPKGATSNSYVTRAAAQTLFDGRLGTTAWDDAADADKDRALIMATARLEQERYVGSKTTLEQRLQWPRYGALDPNGDLYDQDLIPRPVEEATAELALALLTGESTLAETGLEGFDNLRLGPLAVTPRHGRKGGALPQQVMRLLRGLRLGGGLTVPLVRG